MKKKKSTDTMSASAINKELDSLDPKRDKIVTALIEAGRGHETSQETMKLSDPLSLKYQEIQERYWELMREVERRAGPKCRRLPRGFGLLK